MIYKVVRKRDNRFFSCVAYGMAEVEYFLDRWAEPPEWLSNCGLCVFKSFDCAVTFSEAYRDSEVWECEAEEEMLAHSPCSPYSLSIGAPVSYPNIPWLNTYFFRRVRLLRRMY